MYEVYPEIFECVNGIIVVDHNEKTITFYDEKNTNYYHEEVTMKECFKENKFRDLLYILKRDF